MVRKRTGEHSIDEPLECHSETQSLGTMFKVLLVSDAHFMNKYEMTSNEHSDICKGDYHRVRSSFALFIIGGIYLVMIFPLLQRSIFSQLPFGS